MPIQSIDAEVLGAPQTLASPKFTNVSKIFALCDRDELKYVMVEGQTANLLNGHVLVRRHVKAPDGFYNIGRDGELIPTRFQMENGKYYPYVNSVRPPLETMTPFCELPNPVLGGMLQVTQECMRVNGDIVINRHGLYMLQNPNVNYAFGFNVQHQILLDSRYLQVALVEMLQYPSVFLLQEHRPEQGENQTSPVVLGRDWGSCALVMPKRNRGY